MPIGALTSQHFANFYLSGLDRLLLETCRVGGMVRYMDDVVWWCDSVEAARDALAAASSFVSEQLRLELKLPVEIGRCAGGLTFCGFRVLPGALRLSRRRRQRYSVRRAWWEGAYESGEIDALGLQAGYASALAITAHADAAAWRGEQLRRRPLAGAVAHL